MKYLFLLFATFSFITGSAEEAKVMADCRIYFSPDDHLADKLKDLIAKETSSIRIAIYGIFHRGIADALVQAKKRGVNVEMIVDRFSVKKRSPLKRMSKAGIPIYVWSPSENEKGKIPLLHDKFCIFGNRIVWTGSFNFTFEADQLHSENVVLINSDLAAARFLSEYEKIKKKSQRLEDYFSRQTVKTN